MQQKIKSRFISNNNHSLVEITPRVNITPYYERIREIAPTGSAHNNFEKFQSQTTAKVIYIFICRRHCYKKHVIVNTSSKT